MNKPKLKAIRFGTNDVIATSSKFNGYHLYNLGNSDLTDNKLFLIKDGNETGENLFNTYATIKYHFYIGSTQGKSGRDFTKSDSYSEYNGYYTLSGNNFTFVGPSMPNQ